MNPLKKQIRTDKTVRWMTPENKTIELHVIKYEDSRIVGLVESWDNIDHSSVLDGIAYGSARIVNSNVTGIVGHGAIIEDSYVHFEYTVDVMDTLNVIDMVESCHEAFSVNLEGLHLKNCCIFFVDFKDYYKTDYCTGTLKAGEWNYVRELVQKEPFAQQLFDFKEVYDAPDYYERYSYGVRYIDNVPHAMGRLKSNFISDVEIKGSPNGNVITMVGPKTKKK